MKISFDQRKKEVMRHLGDQEMYTTREMRLETLYDSTLKMHETQLELLLDRVNHLTERLALHETNESKQQQYFQLKKRLAELEGEILNNNE